MAHNLVLLAQANTVDAGVGTEYSPDVLAEESPWKDCVAGIRHAALKHNIETVQTEVI